MTGVVRSVALCVSTLVVGSLLAASAASARCPSEPVRGGRLVVAARSEAKHFNPFVAVDQPTKTIASLLHADLLRIDRTDHDVHPRIASAWDVSEDGRTYTITLRDGVRFSDGHPLSADDVVFSFEAYLDERVGSPQRDLLFVGGEPIRVKKIDERRVSFELAVPYAAGERLFDSFHVLPAHLLDRAVKSGDVAGTWALTAAPTQMAGLGPFRVKEVVPGERITLERNPYYWKAGQPYLDEIVFLLIPTEEARVLRLKAGDVHIIERLSAEHFEALVGDSPELEMIDLGPGLEFSFLVFNLDSPTNGHRGRARWFRDRAFRRAVSHAIDRQAVVDLVYRGRASTLATHVTPGDARWLNRELRVEPPSADAAKETLREAGFRWDGAGRLVDDSGARVAFSIVTNAGNRSRAMMASLIQEDLERVGIGVNIVSLEFRAYVDRIFKARDYDAALMALVGGDTDPNTHMSLLTSNGATHVWRLGRETPATAWETEIDRLMREQLVELDRGRRKALYDRVQRIVFDNAPFVALASPHVLVGAASELANFRPGILPPYTLWNADELYLTCR